MKRRVICLVVLLVSICSQHLFSQTEEKQETTKRFSIGLVVGPQFSDWYLVADPEYQWAIDQFPLIEDYKPGYSFGLSMLIGLSNKLSLKTGIYTSYVPFETQLTL